MALFRRKQDSYFDPRARAQMIWTAIVVIVLGLVALEHAANFGRPLQSRSTLELPESFSRYQDAAFTRDPAGFR